MRDIEIFKLFGSIFVDSDEAEKSISKTDSLAKKLGDGLGKGIKTAAKWGAAIGGAAIAGGAALFGMASKSAEATDRIDKLSQKIGISRQGFQELEYVLSQNGTDIEKLQVGLKTLTQRMGEAADGTGKGAEAFERLNLSSLDLNGNLKSQEEMFDETAKALMQLPEGAEKSQLAFDLFGKAGLELMPLLNGSAEGMDELREQAHTLGLVLDDETVAAGAAFTDSMDNVKRSLGSVVTKVGAEVMPIIQKGLDWVMDHMPEIQAVVGVVFEKIGEFVTIAAGIFNDYLMPAFQVVFDWTKENWPAIQSVIKTTIDTIISIVQAFVKLFKTIWEKWGKEITAYLKSIWDGLKIIIDTTIKVIQGIIKTITALISGDWKTAWDGIKDIFVAIWEGMKNLIPKLLEGIYNSMRLSFTVFKDIGKTMFSMVWDGMKGIWSSISNWVGEKVSWLTDKLKFWEKGTKDINDSPPKGSKVDGSNRDGLAYVPFDGYVSELHAGERVLTAKENKEYNNGANGISNNFNISSLVVREEADIKKIAKELYSLQQRTNRGRGLSPS